MRVLLASHAAGPYGAERILLALDRGLTARGHGVTCLFPHDGPAVAAARAQGADVRIADRPRLPRNVGEGIRFFAGLPGTVLAVRRLVRELDPDVVWANTVYGMPAALAGRAAGRPVVWHLHESNLRGPAGWLVAPAVRALASVPVAISSFVADTFGRAGTGLQVLPNPLLDRTIPAGDRGGPDRPGPRPEGVFQVVCVGQLEPRKRVEDAVKAVARLDGVALTVVGDGKARRRVEHAVRMSGAEDRIELVGYEPVVGPFLAASDAVVIPALREPFGLVALEAMDADRPVVAAESGALPEVLGDAALFYPPGDVSALAEGIRALRQEPDLAATLRRRGRERVRSFDTERWLDGVEALLDAARRLVAPDTAASGRPASRSREEGGAS